MRKRLVFLAAAAVLLPLLYTCSKAQGYGVVLWAEKGGQLATGALVSIVKQLPTQKKILVRSRSVKGSLEVESWRLRVFPSRDQAEAEAQAYAPYVDRYAYAQRDGLPLRDQPNQEARRVYKLREGQLVKVLARSEEKVLIASYEDYWYRVLTEDGGEGWCFGYFLPVFTGAGDPQAEAAVLKAQDPLLDALVSTPWRPEYFQEMVEKGRIDLQRFSPEIGFFVDGGKRQALLVLPTFRQSWEYREIASVGPSRYVFSGPELRVTMTGKERMALTYSRKEQQLSQVFINFTEDLEKVIQGEADRREALFQEFLKRGPVMSSSAYGRILLSNGMRFSWEGFGRLADQAFLKRVQGAGSVDFPVFLSKDLAARFDGVITLRFNEYAPGEGTHFLYKFDPAGVRCSYLRPENIKDQEAVSLDASPLVIYFSFGRS